MTGTNRLVSFPNDRRFAGAVFEGKPVRMDDPFDIGSEDVLLLGQFQRQSKVEQVELSISQFERKNSPVFLQLPVLNVHHGDGPAGLLDIVVMVLQPIGIDEVIHVEPGDIFALGDL